MSIPRLSIVHGLVQAAIAGMEMLDDEPTPDEVVSACFTLTARTIKGIMEQAPENSRKLREAAEVLLLACADTTRMN